MAKRVAKEYQERLKELKKEVSQSQKYFSNNVDRFNKFMKFVFQTSLSQGQKGALQSIGTPTIEFNILEAYVSRLRGEFAKQEPTLTVRASDGVPLKELTPEFNEQLKVCEAHLRQIFFDAVNDMLEYNIYTDQLAGGWSVMKVFTEYTSPMSFEQRINVKRAFDPTMCGFDPLARESHKGDGRYCYELFPISREAFEEEYGKEAANDMRFTKDLEGFNWTLVNDEGEEYVLVCDFYEKKKKREKIIKLTNGKSMIERDYKKFVEDWVEAGNVEQPPLPLGESRWTILEVICRYRFCETCVLDYVETSYTMLPLVFVDGNSVTINESGTSTQLTRPYVYHAEGVQRLKNYAGQSLANELENTIQHKFIVPIEAIPSDYQTAYQNVQKADVLVYNHFWDKKNPEVVVPPPREVNRTPIPPEISNTFTLSDQITQAILGSYDGANGINSSDLSGIAFARSAITSNNASMPYIVGFIKGLNRVAQIIIDLIPKYYRTPRSLPILKPDGKRDYVEINRKGSIYMNYDPNFMQVKVEVGINFAMQKEIALQSMVALAQSMPIFAQFMGQYGLQSLLDNLDIRGIEELKQKAVEFEQQLAQQAQAAQQAQQAEAQIQQQQAQMAMAEAQKELNSPSQGQLGLMAIQQQAQRDQEKSVIDAANVAIKEREADTKYIETISKIQNQGVEAEVEMAKTNAENMRSQVNLAIEISKHKHEAEMDKAKHEHEVKQANKPQGNKND